MSNQPNPVECLAICFTRHKQTTHYPVNVFDLFISFKYINITDQPNSWLAEAIRSCHLLGNVEPFLLLIGGTVQNLEIIKLLWSRGQLKAPLGFSIESLSEVGGWFLQSSPQINPVRLEEVICQLIWQITQFEPSCTVIRLFNCLRDVYGTVRTSRPSRKDIDHCLTALTQAGAIYFSGRGYNLLTPKKLAVANWLESIPESTSDVFNVDAESGKAPLAELESLCINGSNDNADLCSRLSPRSVNNRSHNSLTYTKPFNHYHNQQQQQYQLKSEHNSGNLLAVQENYESPNHMKKTVNLISTNTHIPNASSPTRLSYTNPHTGSGSAQLNARMLFNTPGDYHHQQQRTNLTISPMNSHNLNKFSISNMNIRNSNDLISSYRMKTSITGNENCYDLPSPNNNNNNNNNHNHHLLQQRQFSLNPQLTQYHKTLPHRHTTSISCNHCDYRKPEFRTEKVRSLSQMNRDQNQTILNGTPYKSSTPKKSQLSFVKWVADRFRCVRSTIIRHLNVSTECEHGKHTSETRADYLSRFSCSVPDSHFIGVKNSTDSRQQFNHESDNLCRLNLNYRQNVKQHSASLDYLKSARSPNLSRVACGSKNDIEQLNSPLFSTSELQWISQHELPGSLSYRSLTVSPLPPNKNNHNTLQPRLEARSVSRLLNFSPAHDQPFTQNMRKNQTHISNNSMLESRETSAIRDSGFIDGSHHPLVFTPNAKSFDQTHQNSQPCQTALFGLPATNYSNVWWTTGSKRSVNQASHSVSSPRLVFDK